jgi:hypothetical protein
VSVKEKRKLRSFRFWNFLTDFYFGGILVLLSIIGCFVFYSGCIAVKEYFSHELKDKWGLIALPIGIIWLYFNFKGIFYFLRMMLLRSTIEVIEITEIKRERVHSKNGGYWQWKVYYSEGVFEVWESQAKKLSVGQKLELWYKPERKGKGRRNVVIYFI